jgi:hypothetical protein
MTWRDADRPPGPEAGGIEAGGIEAGGIEVSGGPPDRGGPDSDLLELGQARWRRPALFGLVAAAMLLAGLGGYRIGTEHAPTGGRSTGPGAASPSSGSAGSEGQPPVTGTGNRCSLQLGDRLQLGVEIVNQSSTTVTLGPIDAVLPLGGLRRTAGAVGTCGQLSSSGGAAGAAFPAGASTWLTMTFDVLMPCPTPMPVQFVVGYTQGGQHADSRLSAFPDLGGVPYTGCSPEPS